MKEQKKMGLTTQVFIALIAGAIIGIIINMTCISNPIVKKYFVQGAFYIIGQGFIRALQMLVVPLVFFQLLAVLLLLVIRKL